MPQLNLELLAEINNNTYGNTLTIEAAPDFGAFEKSPNLFSSSLCLALLNSNIKWIIFDKQPKKSIESFSLALSHKDSKVVLLRLTQMNVEAVEKLAIILQNPCNVRMLVLERLNAEVVEKLVPSLQSPHCKLFAMGLNNLDEEAVEKLVPSLSHSQSKVKKLTLNNLKAEAVKKISAIFLQQNNVETIVLAMLDATAVGELVPFLQSSHCKLFDMGLNNLDEEAVEKLMPVVSCPQFELKSLILINLSAKAIEKLLPVFQQSDQNLNTLVLIGIDEASVEKLRKAVNNNSHSKITNLRIKSSDGIFLRYQRQNSIASQSKKFPQLLEKSVNNIKRKRSLSYEKDGINSLTEKRDYFLDNDLQSWEQPIAAEEIYAQGHPIFSSYSDSSTNEKILDNLSKEIDWQGKVISIKKEIEEEKRREDSINAYTIK
jgi:hypothetical protein